MTSAPSFKKTKPSSRPRIRNSFSQDRRDVSRGPWKKNGTLHSVIRVSDQAATSACSRTSLRLGFVVPEPIEDPRIRVRQAELRRIPPSLVEGRSKPRNEDWIDFLRTTALVNRGISDRRVSALIGNAR